MDTEAEQKPSRKPQRKPIPGQVPYLRQGYTFEDRQAELELMLLLLEAKTKAAREELAYVTECNKTRTYPGVVFTEGE